MKDILDKKLLLYSTNTLLANSISELFYDDTFYVWCTPFFDGSNIGTFTKTLPPSSTPEMIGKRLLEDIQRNDFHSYLIENNKKGILKGANIKLSKKLITKIEFEEIKTILDKASLTEFMPQLSIIPIDAVRPRLKRVNPASKAHPLSVEYIIEDLKMDEFDLINFTI